MIFYIKIFLFLVHMYLQKKNVFGVAIIVLYQIIFLYSVNCTNISLPNPVDLVVNGVSDKYKPIKLLGEGAQGKVYLAENMRTKEKYALKIQTNQLSAFFYTVCWFKKYLKHENIVKFYASNKDKTYEYLLFEYLPITLFAHLKECKETVGNFMLIMKQMLDVLNFLQNQKIIFMDFKFDNVMEKYGCNSDVYSFGYCSKMYMINILSQNDSFSRDGNDFFKKCLEDDPEKRITADLALLHPFFNVIYNFIFCFSNFENFEALKDGKKIRIKDKILYFEHPEYSFVLHCCCSKNKKEFTKLKEVPNEIFSQQESSKQLPQKILYYRAIIGNDVLPIQHLTFSY
ncbi:protein kinase [Hamiltosporidium magnivora]|uniref:Protein kinase n=1 Tax=Hamiltosporidium magnivora TaxID=148818 RepID=A0A4V2JV08_9MICR|nr:protein kinase [Hamiltosporidium magnivora]